MHNENEAPKKKLALSKKKARNCFLFLFPHLQKTNGATYTLDKIIILN